MYTNEDLENAIEEDIFTAISVEKFRVYISNRNNIFVADEESIKLVVSFNDIFVVIACALLLLCSGWIVHSFHPTLAVLAVSILSWGLAEFFVLKRKMALPAIVLLGSFVGCMFAFVVLIAESLSGISYMLAALVASIGAWFHWKRFNVPITVAAGAVTALIFVVSLLKFAFPIINEYLMFLMFVGGVVIFLVAMRWDAADLKRVTGKSDVAFWLHLTSAPLIVYPVFSNLWILERNESMASVATMVVLYMLLTFVSVVIDRRAFMVSSLVYVLVALTQLLKTYGLVDDSFAYIGVFVGFSLLLLSAFWRKARYHLMAYLPKTIQKKVPLVV